MLAKIRGIVATLSIALYLPIIIVQIYLTRNKEMVERQEGSAAGFFR